MSLSALQKESSLLIVGPSLSVRPSEASILEMDLFVLTTLQDVEESINASSVAFLLFLSRALYIWLKSHKASHFSPDAGFWARRWA
jgi:hypothetical protein